MILLKIACSAVMLINLTNDPWNAKDQKIIDRATYVCSTDYRYKDEFPCLKSLTKKPDQHYQAICGYPKK